MPTFTTKIKFDYPFREDQRPARDARLREQFEAGLLIAEDPTNFDIQPEWGVRVWTTEDAANAHVAWCNETLVPPPISAIVEIT